MVSPSGRVLGWAPDWFFMATKACGGETPDLGFFLGVSGFIGIFGAGFKSGGPRVSDKVGARPRGVGAPSTLVVDLGLFRPNSFALGASSGP